MLVDTSRQNTWTSKINKYLKDFIENKYIIKILGGKSKWIQKLFHVHKYFRTAEDVEI